MLESRQNIPSLDDRSPRAFLLSQENPSLNDRHLASLLDFFGLPWTYITPEEISSARSAFSQLTGANIAILSSAPRFAAAIQEVQQCGGKLPAWIRRADSIYVYGFQSTVTCQNLLRFLTQDLTGGIGDLHKSRAVVSVTPDLPEFCGPLSGIHALASLAEGDVVFALRQTCGNVQTILTVDEGVLFFAVV